MVKKSVISLGVACVLAGGLGLFGCSSTGGTTTEDSQKAPAEQAEQGSAKADSKYAVTIDTCEVTADYSGASAIIVTYTFTNNAEKAQAFFTAVSAKCFQNGVELDTTVVSDLDSQKSMSEIKPGATATVQKAYKLDDQSEVSVECSEMFNFKEEIIAEKTFAVA